VILARRWSRRIYFTRSLSALVVCASVAGCAASPNPETFFVPQNDTPIAAAGQTWVADGPSAPDWSYVPDLGGYSDDLFLQQLWQQGSGAEKAFGMAPGSPLNPGGPNQLVEQAVQNIDAGAKSQTR
jgi:hypothetical protein